MMDHQNKPKKENQTNKTLLLGLFAFIFFLVTFFCSGYVIFPFIELSINSFIEVGTGLDWDRLSGFTSLVTMSLLFAGLVFGLADRVQKERTAKDEKNKLNYQYFSTISDRLTDPRQEEARRWIIDTFKNDYLNEPSPEEMAAIVRKKLLPNLKHGQKAAHRARFILKW